MSLIVNIVLFVCPNIRGYNRIDISPEGDDPVWRSFILRGSTLVDSYGNAVLFFQDVRGRPQVLRQARDGYFY